MFVREGDLLERGAIHGTCRLFKVKSHTSQGGPHG